MVEDRWFIYQHPPGHYETPIYRNGCAGYIHDVEQCPWTINGFKPEKLEIAVQIDAEAQIKKFKCTDKFCDHKLPLEASELAGKNCPYCCGPVIPYFVPPDGTKEN